MNNVIKFELVKVDPQTELAIEKGEYRIRNEFGEVVPACKLNIVVLDEEEKNSIVYKIIKEGD